MFSSLFNTYSDDEADPKVDEVKQHTDVYYNIYY